MFFQNFFGETWKPNLCFSIFSYFQIHGGKVCAAAKRFISLGAFILQKKRISLKGCSSAKAKISQNSWVLLKKSSLAIFQNHLNTALAFHIACLVVVSFTVTQEDLRFSDFFVFESFFDVIRNVSFSQSVTCVLKGRFPICIYMVQKKQKWILAKRFTIHDSRFVNHASGFVNILNVASKWNNSPKSVDWYLICSFTAFRYPWACRL